ncbi:MAG: glycine--tRNA ligase subunit beta [Tabrizicola sp.]|uniref:glycine--tRNA ligase subunit beta n=1 Tax=Tabrizicola sp. TaxID=2005166 RepID=UPI0027364CB4|nr:glycine--tRNA ligase subunit beta [Tabrizicola sp.]MDP3261763.1 glycine--tRNA ligase subunit beta [Tabrizicola sp.]MDP3648853.1 glycine--tRNA ligase subunit beta [Paracoccaceae bacterium]MDZ4069629.1 glycine--tRNA ligase subunit beta [Tabrizicola sp.]
MPDLLIELFSEEIPARMQARAREDLKKLVTDGLVEAGLTYASAGAFSTPRRLVLSVEGLTAESRPVREERKGPAVTAPAAAVEGFLRSTGLVLEQLERRADKKGEVYFAVVEKLGRTAPEIVAEVLEGVIRNFPWPKSMRWGSGTLRWVRPLQRILCLLSDEAGAHVVPLEVDGIVAGNVTEGHRFMGAGPFPVHGFDDYVVKLKRAFVVLDSAEREAAIWQGAENAAFAAGMEVVPDAGLLAEVAGLVEWPVVLIGRIAPAFLDLPPEVLQTSMKEHQKFFSVRAKSGRIEGFVTVANIDAADGGATILQGNQKVLSARLSDAKFFWENDLRVARAGMGEWLDGLKAVTFHGKLGSQAERVERIAALAREIAPMVGADPALAEQAARVAKADLRSAMVGEFPELQGLMGMYYARAAGMPEAVALAARDHYSPLGPSDAVPTEPVSVAVALADKIDTLTGFWAIDEKPTGSKDPFALRRAALGVIRLVLASHTRISLITGAFVKAGRLSMASLLSTQGIGLADDLGLAQLKQMGISVDEARPILLIKASMAAANALKGSSLDKVPPLEWELSRGADLLAFLHDRLKVFLRDQGIRHDIIDACLAMPGNDDLTLLVKRAEALAAVMKTEDGANLLQGYKRANNILTQAEAKDGVEYSYGADVKFAEGPEEKALFAALDAAEAKIGPAMAAEDFAAAMAAMAALRGPLDAFFTAVQVNADSAIIRRNRLNLLSRIRTICSGVADLSRIEG